MAHGQPPDVFPQGGEVAALMRSKDWSQTALGPPSTWPPSLRTILRLMLTSRYAMWLAWGPDLLFFYNDAYREQTLGKKHPWALGRPADEVWAEIWDQIGPRVEVVLRTGEASWEEGLLLFLERNGFSEETYHTFSYSPALDDESVVRGLFCVVIEESERVVGARRIALLRDFASAVGRASTTTSVLAAMRACLANESRDLPFTLTYLFDDDGATARLASLTTIDADHPTAPQAIAMGTGASESAWPLASVYAESRPIDVVLGEKHAWPAGAWKKPPTHAIVVPITQAGHTRPAGALVAALNPHRPYDASYRSFIELFVGQLAAALDNARAYESERKRAEALAQIDRAKTAFFSNVSHEFRTPLTLMLGPTEDALASPERALRGDDLDIVHRNELRLMKLVNALLDFARIEAGRVDAHYRPTDLAALTTDLASAFRSAMARGGLRYDVACEPLTQPVYVDRDMWEKIVLNLLSNALKFTLAGFVSVSLRARDAGVELVVRDSGPGIAAAELPRMFERFHRIEGAPARTQEGSGIGLALVRDLVELHGGTIAVASELGHGTAFTVSIPFGTAHLPADRVGEVPPDGAQRRAESFVAEAMRWIPDTAPAERHGAASLEAAAGPATAPDTARVLVADDNADMRDYVARLLRQRWTVETVGDGHAALEAIRKNPPDVVLSDVMMPGLDGFALVERLRADPATRTVPVILLSARAGEEATDEGLRTGANDYVVKPFSARDLVGRVASQITIAKIRKEAEAEKEAQQRVVQSLFMNAPAGIALIRGEAQIIEFANPMALDIWGKTRDVVGKPLLDALPELRGQGFDDLVRQVVRTEVPFVGEELPVTIQRSGATETSYLKFVYAPAQNERGVVDGVAAFGFDVTTHVVARQRATLAATVGRVFVSKEDLGAQLRHCCEALVGFGAAFARIWTYNAAHDVLELRASAGLYTHTDGPHARVRVGTYKIGRIAQSRQPHLTNSVIGDPDVSDQAWARHEGMVAFAGYPLCVGDRLAGVMAVFSKTPLSEHTLATLASIADQLALGIERDSSERFRELFIGMLGHDLRNPLNAVNMATHVLAGGQLAPAQLRTVERIRGSAHRMARMIDQVLDFTRARAGGGIPIERAPSDLHAICAQAIEELATAQPERVIATEYRGDTRGAWDADRLAQVFSNLVGNALTYGAPHTPVRVVVEGKADEVVCTVHNEGPAIPAALIPALFDPFRRAAHGKTVGTGGLGLGLFIAQQIVMAHGGGITVRSSDEEGTDFTFVVPRLEETA